MTAEAKEWAVTLPDGSTIAVLDLAFDDVVTVAVEASAAIPLGWIAAVKAPLSHPLLAEKLVRLACSTAGQKPPGRLTARTVYDLFKQQDVPADATPLPPVAAPAGRQWALQLPGGEPELLWDVRTSDVSKLSETHDVWWIDALDKPLMGDGKLTKAWVALIADRAGVEAPDGLTVREWLAMWTLVDDDKPTSFDNGFPDPKATTAEDDAPTP